MFWYDNTSGMSMNHDYSHFVYNAYSHLVRDPYTE